MTEYKNKNDYSISVFDAENNFILKWQFVHGLYSAANSLTKSHPNWQYMNVYARRSGRYLKRYYRDNYIDNKPRL